MSSAFAALISQCGKKLEPRLTLVPQYRIPAHQVTVIVDGALVDLYHLPHGYWEAKDEKDDLAREVQRKFDKGYPTDNTIFQAPERAIPFASAPSTCHPEAPFFGAEGPMQSAGSTDAADESIDPSARKKRGPQDDKGVFRAFVAAGQRLADILVHYEQQPEYPLPAAQRECLAAFDGSSGGSGVLRFAQDDRGWGALMPIERRIHSDSRRALRRANGRNDSSSG